MKKVIILLFATVFSLNIAAQNFKNDGKPYYFYCELTAVENLKAKILITLNWSNKQIENVVDKNGERIQFNSTVDVLNYMSKRGWDLTQTYEYEGVLRFLFRKLVTNDDEAKEGLYFKSDFK